MTNETLFTEIDRRAQTQPNRTALVDAVNGSVVCYGELGGHIDRLAAALIGQGVRPGSRCILVMQRSVALVEMVLAISRAGGECLPLDCGQPEAHMLYAARQVFTPELVIYDAASRHSLDWKAAGERWIPESFLQRNGREPRPRLPYITPDAPLYLNASSGSTSASTGMSKMVLTTHRNVIANARGCVRALGLQPYRVHMGSFRLHCHELFVRALLTGGTAVLHPRAEYPIDLLEVLRRFQVDYLMTSPLTLAALIPFLKPHQRLNLQLIESGGGPLSPVVKRVISQRTSARVVSVWGSTETAGVALAPSPGRGPHRGGGMPVDGYQVRILKADGTPVARGEEGELVIGGEAVATSYLGSQAGSDRLYGQVFRTGDLARQHLDGWIEIRGRMNNNFKVGSVWVNADCIEQAIRQDQRVREVVVLPIPHRTFGQVPVALVETWPGSDYIPDRALLASRLERPHLEMPQLFLPVERIPTKSGKVDRAASRDLLLSQSVHRHRSRFKPVKGLRGVWIALKEPGAIKRFIRHPLQYLRLLRVLGRERGIQ